MKRILPLLFVGMTLTGCQETDQIDLASLTPQEREAVSTLSWLRDADASRDVEQASRQGDTRLYVFATRIPTLSGIPAETLNQARASCGTRTLPGSTDMVRGKVHLKLLQQARDYAAEYNRLMLDTCLKRSD
jgi:hypothetical protein